jgi:cell shape-determining protein MreC
VKIAGIILPSYQNCIVGINASQDTGNLSLSIGYLSDVNGVNEGDAVISSGKDGITPFGLKIGAIIKSESNFFVSTKKQIFDSLIVQVIID